MNVILLGPPGAGKGTQSDLICEFYNLDHLSTGNLLRQAKKDKTNLGLKAASFMDHGHLVPDDLVLSIVNAEITEDSNLLFDGFPRTIMQAEQLQLKLSEKGLALDLVINLKVEDSVVVERLSLRRLCPECGEIYHLKFKKPSAANECLNCKVEVIQRVDDQEETILERLGVYRKQTKPLESFYKEKGLLLNVDGNDKASQVFEEIKIAIG